MGVMGRNQRGLRRLRVGAGVGVSERVQNSVTCCVAAAALAVPALPASRFVAAAACERALPITLFAPLSHRLMNGFFFSQGLLMSVLPVLGLPLKGCQRVIRATNAPNASAPSTDARGFWRTALRRPSDHSRPVWRNWSALACNATSALDALVAS